MNLLHMSRPHISLTLSLVCLAFHLKCTFPLWNLSCVDDALENAPVFPRSDTCVYSVQRNGRMLMWSAKKKDRL